MRTTAPGRVLLIAGGILAASAGARAQTHARHAGGHATPTATAPSATARVIAIPVVEASAMMQRQRVYLFTAPAGSSAYGIGMMGEGHRVWALLPSCRTPNPDDPRDPCPVGRVVMEVIAGSGTVASNEPQTIGNAPDARRVQSFVVPNTVEQLRIKILRHSDEHVRYEAAVDAVQLGNLPAPQGQPHGPDAYVIALAHYPAL
jgi:hypothetical protein